ncbi:MAG: type II toxin-antitoxin system HicA family toxin [Ignavibacteria bacterium]|nr:type II toxin-antitoxin system HicA family toxin [Ignavibacteria bacterium]
MPKPRHLSGDEIIAILSKFGFSVHSQRGSHVKLRRLTSEGVKQTLTIPRHKELDPGTAHAIFRQSSRYIPEDQLLPLFFF